MIRKRKCNWCNVTYAYKHPSSKFCSSRCRVRNSQGVKTPRIKPFDMAELVDDAVLAAKSAVDEQFSQGVESPLVAATRRALESAEKFDSVQGQQAMRLAEAMSARETGAGLAALSKALTSVMEELAGSSSAADDVLDELKARRAARRAG